MTVEGFVMNEDRYADLSMIDPAEAATLRPELQSDCNRNIEILKYLSKQP